MSPHLKPVCLFNPKAGSSKAGRLAAEVEVEKRGMKLASNLSLCKYPPKFETWARELLVHPEQGGKFIKDMDVVDSTGWTLEAKYLNPESINYWIVDGKHVDKPNHDYLFRENVGLFIDPEKFIISLEKKVLIVPATIVLLHPFIQKTSTEGTVNKHTCVPLDQRPETAQEQMTLYRLPGVGVKPIIRTTAQSIRIDCKPDTLHAVAGVPVKDPAPKNLQVEPAENGIVISGITAPQLKELLGKAEKALQALHMTVRPGNLRDVDRFVRAFRIKG
jgi:hypothetical protein